MEELIRLLEQWYEVCGGQAIAFLLDNWIDGIFRSAVQTFQKFGIEVRDLSYLS
jgi:hypothetical protein